MDDLAVTVGSDASLYPMSDLARYLTQTNVAATEWDPYPLPAESIRAGDPAARVHWCRVSGPGEPAYYAGLWTAQPSTFDYTFELNEALVVLEGHFIVTVEGHAPVHFRAGDVATFRRGARTRWEVVAPMKKFFVDTP